MNPGPDVIEGTARDVIAKLAHVPPDAPVHAVIGQPGLPLLPRQDLDAGAINDAETGPLAAAVAASDADPRTVPHDAARAWLLRLACGEFDATPPAPG